MPKSKVNSVWTSHYTYQWTEGSSDSTEKRGEGGYSGSYTKLVTITRSDTHTSWASNISWKIPSCDGSSNNVLEDCRQEGRSPQESKDHEEHKIADAFVELRRGGFVWVNGLAWNTVQIDEGRDPISRKSQKDCNDKERNGEQSSVVLYTAACLLLQSELSLQATK